MHASTNLLTNQLNTIKHKFFPLGRHAIANDGESVRHSYATLLAAILHSQHSISREQEMLYRRLLDSIDLAQHQEAMLLAGHQLEKEDLKEILIQIKISNKADAFIFDAMVLTRINKSITAETHQLLSEISELLSLRRKNIEPLLLWINILLFNKNMSKITTYKITNKTNRGGYWPKFLKLEYHSYKKRILVKNKVFIKENENMYIKEDINGGGIYVKAKSSGLVILKEEKNKDEFKTEFYIINFPENLSAWMNFIDFDQIIEQS